MGVENRDWYRKSNAYDGAWGDWGLYHLTPVVKYLIIINVVVFVLQIFMVRHVPMQSPLDVARQQDPELDRLLTVYGEDPAALREIRKIYPKFHQDLHDAALQSAGNFGETASILQDWLALDTKKVMHGQVWRLLTHAFCHDGYGIFHILFNMLFLYWFGCTLESMYGSREFLLFYLTAALASALAYVALDLYTGSSIHMIGASGAVMAVTMLYVWHFPRETICVFWVLRVEIRWLLVILVIWDLHPILLALGGDRMFTGVAHAAHLGGLAFAFLYAKFQWRLEALGERLPGLRWQRTARPRLNPDSGRAALADPEMDRVDQILEKISKTGEASLTDDERAFLRDASSRMKNRRWSRK